MVESPQRGEGENIKHIFVSSFFLSDLCGSWRTLRETLFSGNLLLCEPIPMIEILLKNKETILAEDTSKIEPSGLDFFIMQLRDYSDADIHWLEENFDLDFAIMKHYEDIEISSHFLEDSKQAAFHFSIPYSNRENKMVEDHIFIIMSNAGVFLFSTTTLDGFFNKVYSRKVRTSQGLNDRRSVFKFQFAFISDYYADVTENLSRKIKRLANAVLIEKEFTSEASDAITKFNFSNLLLKEALIETTRVFTLYVKSDWEEGMDLKESIKAELNDLRVISDYIQFNFDRLDDLKENISNKIDLEQNYIFKMLTVVTVCISLPTLIAGVYGMNFKNMPELHEKYGYPTAIIVMILSIVLSFWYFKRKKWL